MRRVMLAAVLTVALSACWQQAGFDSGGSNFSPLPVGVTAANVGTLTHAFTYPVKNANAMVVANGRAFVAKDRLYAFDAAGTTGCSGSPAVCTPVWTSNESGTFQSVVVGAGKVWASYVSAGSVRKIVAFGLDGTTGCSGSPLVCSPVLTIPGVAGALRWAGDTLHVSTTVGTSSTSALHLAYRSDGTQLWSAVLGTGGSPFSTPVGVIDGNVVIAAASSSGTPLAYDARGITNCTGTPAVCSPMWAYDGTASQLAARDGSLFARHEDRIAVYDAQGSTGCYGTPKVCYPIWRTFGPAGQPLVTGDHVVVAYGGSISEYPLDQSHCSGIIRVCAADGSGNSVDAFDLVADAAAGGLAYGTRKTCTSLDCAAGTVSWFLDAWDLNGMVAGCVTPCHEVWAGSVPGPAAEVEIVDGAVYYRPETLNNVPPADIWGFRPAA